MISFIELVPVKVPNENYEQELKEYKQRGEWPLPPDEFQVRHENKFVGQFDCAYVKAGEIIEIEGTSYKVECVGPKEFLHLRSDFTQTIYIKKL